MLDELPYFLYEEGDMHSKEDGDEWQINRLLALSGLSFLRRELFSCPEWTSESNYLIGAYNEQAFPHQVRRGREPAHAYALFWFCRRPCSKKQEVSFKVSPSSHPLAVVFLRLSSESNSFMPSALTAFPYLPTGPWSIPLFSFGAEIPHAMSVTWRIGLGTG